MRNIKSLVIALVLGLAGMVYAAGNMTATTQTQDKAKAESCCCCMKEGACPMKSHEHADSHAAMDCCQKGKDGEDCCAAMADHGKAGDKQQHDGSCCNMHHEGGQSADKQSCEMGKDGHEGCCNGGAGCCHDGGCCKAGTAKS